MSRYHCIINGVKIENIEECSVSGINDAIIDSDILDEIVDDIKSRIDSIHGAVCENFSWNFVEKILSYIDCTYKCKYIPLFDENDKEVEVFSLKEIFYQLCDKFYSDENGCVQAGHIWTSQLEEFIKHAKWSVSLKSDDGETIVDCNEWPKPIISRRDIFWTRNGKKFKPIIWFGIEGTKISELWTVNNETFPALVKEEDGMGEYGGQLRIDGFELNYPLLFDDGSVESWYFGCGGNEGADFSKILRECPICLNELFEKHNGNEQVARYCYMKQNK